MVRIARRVPLVPAAVFLGGLLLFVSTLAPSVVFGDPAEYTFVPYVWGIVHPPGYAVQTLLAKLWQTLIPIGTIAYRTNLLSAAAGAATITLVFGIVSCVSPHVLRAAYSAPPSGQPQFAICHPQPPIPVPQPLIPALFAAAILATASDFWQHAIHANAHIVTATLAALSLFCLLVWRASQNDRWLYAFAFVAGLSVTHHPLLVFSFPAYAVFVLAVRPGLYRNGRQIMRLTACALAGLTPWLYLPIRSSLAPPPVIGPHDMNTLDGFLNLVLARGLAGVNLFHFGPGQQWQRAVVFWSILRLQFPLPVIALIPIGLVYLWRRDLRTASLFTLFLGINLLFIFNTVQDVMAYSLGPLVGLAIIAGVGAIALVEWVSAQPGGWRVERAAWLLLLLPLVTGTYKYPRISLRHYTAADEFVDSLFARFKGKGEGAILLSDWEHLTPLWYRQYVVGQGFDPADLTPVFVSGGDRPWVDNVWKHFEDGPIYVLEYQPQIVAEGFRLRADGRLYRVLPPPATEVPAIPYPLSLVAGDQIEVLGYDLAAAIAQAGDVVPFTLYLRAPKPLDDILFPNATLGPYRFQWTTDSHLLTPYWRPGEVIAERFDLTIPLDAPGGDLPLAIGMADLTTGADLPISDLKSQIPNPQTQTLSDPTSFPLVTIRIEPIPGAPSARILDGLAANFGQRVGLDSAGAWAGGRWNDAPWGETIAARPGEAIQVIVRWRALAPIEDSLTVFLHLLDAGNNLWAGQDYTPLGGAFPTMLWFPKWIEGQSVLDPYTLTVPADAPPGDYTIELGLYGLRTIQRVPAFDRNGNLAGDRFVLGGVRVER